eukprot:scaffold30467_cov101-Isochrysis_galbana.AAC.2
MGIGWGKILWQRFARGRALLGAGGWREPEPTLTLGARGANAHDRCLGTVEKECGEDWGRGSTVAGITLASLLQRCTSHQPTHHHQPSDYQPSSIHTLSWSNKAPRMIDIS